MIANMLTYIVVLVRYLRVTQNELPPPAPEDDGHETGDPRLPENPQHEPAGVSKYTRTTLTKMLALLDPTTPRKLEDLGILLHRAGQYTDAEAVYRECIHYAEVQKQAPLLVCCLYTTLADILVAQNNYGEALRWLHKAYELADGMPLSILRSSGVAHQLSETYRTLGQAAEAGHWEEVSKITGRGFLEQRFGPFPES